MINGGLVFAVGNAPVDLYPDLSPSKILGDQIDEMTKALAEGGAPEEAAEALGQVLSSGLGILDSLFSSSAKEEGGGSGIVVFPGDSLTIKDGIVVAQGGPDSAGIGRTGMGSLKAIYSMFGGGNIDLTPGPITISGGSVFATGGKDAAGLGGGGKIYVDGRPTVIATRGGDTAKDVWAELIQERSSLAWCSYLRLEVKDKNSGKPLAGKKVTVAGVPYFSNMDGVIGCFVPRPFLLSRGYGPIKISAIALAPPGFPGGSTEITSQENSIRATIELDFPLKNITLQGVSGDSSADIPLQLTPAFDPLQTNYALYVENSVKSVKVTPEKVAGDAVTTVQVNGTAVKAGEAAEVPLQFGENNILVTVSLPAEEWAPGATPVQKQYSIKVNRANMKITPK
uniref:cadherin-like beta sandwich domain-containing protein n=1 Tax=Syntrophomonas palmitatica TaxID=402877 RepID=UPI000A4219E6